MPKVTVNNPNMDKGELVEVQFLGMFENGGTHDVTDEQVATWQALTGREYPKDGLDTASDFVEPQSEVETTEAVAEPVAKATKSTSAPVESSGGAAPKDGDK